MIICKEHGEELDKVVPENMGFYFLEGLGVNIIKYLEREEFGDLFEYDWYKFEKEVEASGGCPFCFFKTLERNDFLSFVVEEFNKGLKFKPKTKEEGE